MHTTYDHPIPQVVRTHLPTIPELRRALSSTPRYIGARHITRVCNGLIVALSETDLRAQQDEIAECIVEATEILLRLQSADGSISSVNLQSPPDTAFVVQSVSYGLRVLKPYRDTSIRLGTAHENLRNFLHRSRYILRTGGVHTPNHRWVMCAALAALFSEFQDSALIDRLQEWLAEGIDIDKDGQFCERSSAIYSAVSSECLMETALLTADGHLLEPIRRNLETTLYLVGADGRMETSASRRQDQFRTDLTIAPYYFSYVALSRVESNPLWSQAVSLIESTCAQLLSNDAVKFLAFHRHLEELRSGELKSPIGTDRTSIPSQFDRFFSASGLFRRRRDRRSTTVFFGADDQPDIAVGCTASGRSSCPNIVTFRNGAATCGWVRVAPYFFGVGYLRPHLVSRSSNRFELADERSVGYVQPLPHESLQSSGIYPLTTSDSRYWSAASLDRRRVSDNQHLKCSISIELYEGGCSISVEADCSGETPIWFEIAVPPGTSVGPSDNSGEGRRRDTGAGRVVLSATDGATGVEDRLLLEFAPQNAADWVPDSKHLGDVDSARLVREAAEHGSRELPVYSSFFEPQAAEKAGLKLLAAPFVAPGSAVLTIGAVETS